MYSNFITPPDFVTDDNENLVIINATNEEIILLANYCKNCDKSYNIYLYQSAMDNRVWLDQAILLSKHIIVNDIDADLEHLCSHEKTFYYGSKSYLTPANKINFILDYFQLNT